jgi:lysophospholipase L1-like esterase
MSTRALAGARQRAMLPRILLLVSSVSIPIGVVEYGLRCSWERENARLLDVHRAGLESTPDPDRLILLDLLRVSGDLDIVYDLRPNIRGIFHGVPLRINAHGLRGPEIQREKAPGVTRIAVIGDSFTFGWGVAEEDSFPALLGRQLAEVTPGASFEVLNFGVPGTNTAMQEARLTRVVMQFQPDLVLHQFYSNDDRVPILITKMPRPPRSCVAERARRLFSPDRAGASELGPRLEFNPVTDDVPDELAHLAGRDAACAALRRMAVATKAAGIPFVSLIISMPDEFNLDPASGPVDERDRWFTEQCERLGIETVHALPHFREWLAVPGRSPRDLAITPRDVHPNATGHRILARAVLQHLVGRVRPAVNGPSR